MTSVRWCGAGLVSNRSGLAVIWMCIARLAFLVGRGRPDPRTEFDCLPTAEAAIVERAF